MEIRAMLPGLKDYLDGSTARDISLVLLMKKFSDIHEKDRIIETWSGVLSYLQQHSSSEKRQLYRTPRKYTAKELEKIIDKELQEREHDRTLLVNVSRQELAASRMHTKQVEERFYAETETSTVTSTTIPVTASTTASMATSTATDEDLDDDEDGDNPVLDPHTARARASPFYNIVDFIFKKDPPLPALPSGLSPTYNEMFRAALQLLQEPGDVSRKKPVFALVSGIINTLSPVGQQFTLSPFVEEQSRMACLSYRSKVIDDLRADLQKALYPDPDDPAAMSVESLRRFVYESLSQCLGPHTTRAAKEKYLVLRIVSQVLHWLENDIFSAPLSEHVYVSAWSDVLNTLLAQSGLRGIPGELGSRASRESRSLTESVFGGKMATCTSSRKVDMTIRVYVDKSWANEICVFECKPEVSDQVCQVQQGKSVRLNTVILLALEEKGLDITQCHPIIAETRALSIDFYTLRRYGDVIGAGRSTQEKVWLPSEYTKLDAFLSSRSFEVLLGFRAYMALYAKKATAALASSPATPHSTFPVSAHLSSPATPRSTSTPSTPLTSLTSTPASVAPVTPTFATSQAASGTYAVQPTTSVITEPPPPRPTTPPPRKRDHPFVVFSPSKSQRRGRKSSMDYDGPNMHDDDDLAL
ncbi:hypothetical protein BGZ95_008271 [Linnemannia exigua]|uniref:Uncharacterized protein n=1 Tax=Linnemannia exigua TaxID=604196 RepID=A0AAD4DE94_9FUNG|nr:hypothetical protein BGZ95_008271 [Linnemannia exigua]